MQNFSHLLFRKKILLGYLTYIKLLILYFEWKIKLWRKKNVQYANLGGYCSSPPFPGSYRTRPLGTIDFTDPGGGLHNPPVYVWWTYVDCWLYSKIQGSLVGTLIAIIQLSIEQEHKDIKSSLSQHNKISKKNKSGNMNGIRVGFIWNFYLK